MVRCLFCFFCVAATSLLSASEPSNQWYLRGPDGGFSQQVAIDLISHRPIAGGDSGIFKYDPNLNFWNYANAGAPTPFVGGIATTPTATFVNSGGYVARSTDGGTTWTNVSGIAMTGTVNSIAASPNVPSRVHAALNPGGLYRSDDLGASWHLNPLTPPDAAMDLVRVSPTNGNLMFVSPQPDQNGISYLFRSSDGGVTFSQVIQSGGTPASPLHFVDVVQSVSDPLAVAALVAPVQNPQVTTDQGGEIWISNDAGLTWNVNVPNFYLAPETGGGGEPRAIFFDRFTANTAYIATTFGVFKSVNDSAAVLSSTGMLQMGPRDSGAQPYDEVDSLAQADDGTLYAATRSGGLYKSSNGATSWTAVNAGYTGLNIRIFAFQPGNTGVVLAGSADPSTAGAVFRSTDFGTSWTRSSFGLNAAAIRGLAFSPAHSNVVLAGGFQQAIFTGESSRGVWRSTDGGQSWNKINDAGLRFNVVRIIVFDPGDGNRVLAASQRRVNISTNEGVNWINSQDSPGLFGGLPFDNNPDLILLGLAAGPKSGGGTRFYATIYNNLGAGAVLPPACQNDAGLACRGGVYFSDDGGYHWTRGTGVTGDSASYLSVAATAGTLFVSQTNVNGYAGGVYKSTDYGQTWTDSSSGLPCRYNFTVAADPSNAQVVWTGCVFSDITHPGGIYRSNDGGASWLPYGRGLRNEAISWLTVDPADSGHILAGAAEGVDEMRFAPDADQDGIPDSEEAIFGTVPGDANDDGTQDSTQANVASIGIPAGPLAPSLAKTTAAGDYVVVEVDLSQPHNGSCARVSDLSVISTDQIALSNRMQQAAPTIRFILPDCQSARVNIRYSAVTSYPNGVLGSYSPQTPGDGTTLAWGTFATTQASVDGNGLWSVELAENAFGNVYAPGSGAILFQGAPGKDAVFANGFD